ncbi:PREDICTED: uncharacterized protein LOC104605144 isoform X2 [Nelumbo nucifera]|uniref:Uncharacterized protein LOC104605144 isoform X2 n=1 Tax=Nelumbo nucifera TaxID=4432 RepID=A0A1U8AK62_NELNU|nr:PREDICTED: uncharacterized protein LOC104605144 isoform X2 [Nelumbo nucifera]
MSSCSNVQSVEEGGGSHQKSSMSNANLSEDGEGHLEPEEDEDEDVDFNPFLKESPSEASSSLSSENEGLGADVVDNAASPPASKNSNLLPELTNKMQDIAGRDSDNDEEVVMQTRVSPEGDSTKESEEVVPGKCNRTSALDQPNMGTSSGKKNASISESDSNIDVINGELPDLKNTRNPIIDLDDEDAICRRTRARYSLANFTLDELETFLQETDDDDDLQNVDDEEEYRKFLTAVLQGGDGEGHSMTRENENVDDEDEENDADFDIEIEEALESDLDETTQDKDQKEKYEGVGRRPETRQNKRQKVSVQNRRKLLGQVKRPLRPLLPFVPNKPMEPSAVDWSRITPEGGLRFPSSAQVDSINGFTPHQIGQLYCLIHEHIQLLIQVFSLCVLEPSRQHIASEVQRMISEVVHKRNDELARRNIPYPGIFFYPPYIHPSVSDELPKFRQVQHTGRHDENVYDRQVDSSLARDVSLWMPLISGPILSILDVAPLNLVGGYMTDVSVAAQKYQQRHVEAQFANHFEREPLFPLPNFHSFPEANVGVSRGATPQGPNTVPSSLPAHQQPKKTLAASLVESTKKQSVAPVPKEIAKLAQRFFPLFNSALFPHKPPPAAVANRVLFTDSEDELLAMGLMEYNTDWKAIQQRFLPCKSKHQIFVRQKNRCSSKAPENPIKAVRRMKTSPLTVEEKARIHEGLRVLKLDWMSIWKYIVPYRDPSLLPRQWRIALGTQKSYKTDAAKKEKRRLYESKRRKQAALARWQTISDKEDFQVDNADEGNNSGDGNTDDEDEAYVHEAFLADWRPGNSKDISYEHPLASLGNRNLQLGGQGELQQKIGSTHEILPALSYSQHLQNASHLTQVSYNTSLTPASTDLSSERISTSSRSQVSLRPYRVRRRKFVQVVKLAPDLPPVNLPPSVRVISQSAFKSYHCGSSYSSKISGGACGGNVGAAGTDLLPRLHIAKSGFTHLVNVGEKNVVSNDKTASLCPQDPGLPVEQHIPEEKGAEPDLQMHPLLFQAPEDGSFPYYPLKCGTASSAFAFLPQNQLQTNLNLLCKPHPNPQVDSINKSLRSKETSLSSCIDFHPLLRKTDNINDSVDASSTTNFSINLTSFQGNSAQSQNPSDCVLIDPQVRCCQLATGTVPTSSFEKANELDLEIHLSSSSRIGCRGLTEHRSKGQQISALDCGPMVGKVSSPSYQSSKHYTAASVSNKQCNKEHALGTRAMVQESRNINIYTEDNTGDQSLPEIVMEQEELSDSDDEIGENVQFECEEMADSEGEETDHEQFLNIQNKDVLPVAVEDVARTAACDDQQCELRICGPQAIACDATESSTASCKLGFTKKCKDIRGRVLQSTSDPLGYLNSPRPSEESRNGNDQTGKSCLENGLPSRPKRSSRKMMPYSKAGTAEQHGTGTTGGAPTSKARKRKVRNASITGVPGCSNIDNLVDCHSCDSPRIDDLKLVANSITLDSLTSGDNTGSHVSKEVE